MMPLEFKGGTAWLVRATTLEADASGRPLPLPVDTKTSGSDKSSETPRIGRREEVILFDASDAWEICRERFALVKQEHPDQPVIILLDPQHADLDRILALPADDFHSMDSPATLLYKRMERLSVSKTQWTSFTDNTLLVEEAEVWRTLFEKAGAGMLTGRPGSMLGTRDRFFPSCEATDAAGWNDCIRQCLTSIDWELNNSMASELLELPEPVALSNGFIHRLESMNPEQFAADLEQLGTEISTIRGEFVLTTRDGEARKLSAEFSIPDTLDDVLLVTWIDITQRVDLERELRDHVNLLESRVVERTKAMRLVNHQLQEEGKQRKRLAEQVRESLAHITQGVISAKKILEVALPGKEEMRALFPKSMLIERPRDIMGGDFLFTAAKGNRKTLALIDSTGHGIPGAMVSLMGSTLINRAYASLEDPSPADILTHFHEGFHERLQVSKGTTNMYGFDAGFLTLDESTGIIEFAGARGDLYLVRNGETKIFRGTRSSIELNHYGQQGDAPLAFAVHTIELQPGDQFYMVTDGVRDQFGGEFNRKLGRKRLADILAEYSHLDILERERTIQQALMIWKGANPKVDDATLVGIDYTFS